jgi:hypothetical protein
MARADSTFTTRRTFVRLSGAAAAVAVAPASAAPKADAELIALRQELELAWQVERGLLDDAAAELFEVAYRRCSDIVNLMFKYKATSLAGLQAKAVAIMWCIGDDDDLFLGEFLTTDCKMANGLLDDLLAIRGDV